MSEPPAIGFRPMTADDLPLVATWLDRAHVQPWWTPRDLDEIRQAVRDEVAIEPWILVVDGRDCGYFQCYAVGVDDDYAALVAPHGIGPTTADIDYLIGEADAVGRGIGTTAIGRFVAEIVFGRGDCPGVVACPHPDNVASRRVLEKNGFRSVAPIVTPEGPEQIMFKARPEEHP